VGIFGAREEEVYSEQSRLGNMLILSCIVHFLGFSFLFVLPGIPSTPRIDSVPNYTPVKLVDLNDLPARKSISITKAKKNLRTAKPTLIKKKSEVKKLEISKTIAPPKKVVPKKSSSPPAKSSKKDKTKEAASSPEEDQRLRQAVDDIRNRVAAGGPTASAAFGIRGRGKAGEIPEILVYTSIVVDRIMQAWFLPPALEREASHRDLLTVIGIRIDRDGNVLFQGIERKSGNALYDKYALAAIKKIQTDSFPPLPTVFRDRYLDLGIRFNPSEKNNS
jgi:hypothetical protein